MTTLPITRLTIREAARRRLVLAGLLASLGFVGLFALGFAFLYRRAADAPDESGALVVFAATVLTVLGLYTLQFLAAFLMMFLATGAVSSEIDSGTLHAVLSRPLGRQSWLLQRALAFAGLVLGYVVIMTAVLLLIARAVAGYEALDPLRAVGLLVLEVTVLLALGLAASTRWSTLAAGVTVFSLFGLAWLAGIIEFVGETLGNDAMQTIGIAISLLIPSDALWRGASYYLSSPAFLVGTPGGGAVPFVAVTPPSGWMVVWSVGYVVVLLGLAVHHFRRRDL